MSNPLISITFPRGWWHTITDAVRDAGPECAGLAADLERAVTEGQGIELGHADSAKAGPYAVTQAELVAAIQKAEDRVNGEHGRATSEYARTATYAAGRALRVLWQALLNPERDGAATPPANPTGAPTPSADESATGATHTGAAPSRPHSYRQAMGQGCAKPHPWMENAWCTLNRHPDKRHEAQSADQYRTVVGWSE